MPDSSDIDAALVAKLAGDATLTGLMPNGVFFGQSPPNSTRYVLVALPSHADQFSFGARAFEDGLYAVKAVGLSTANPNMKAAAARIDALLDHQSLTASGYTHMATYREERIRHEETDDVDATIRWFHRGGLYRVVMST